MRLQRITSSGRWFPEIDGLRFIAIMAVLLLHVLNQTTIRGGDRIPSVAQYAPFLVSMHLLIRGVQLFFVISGFILAQPFIRQFLDGVKPVSLRAFYLRRITRLEPPYLLSLLLYALSLVLLRGGTPKTVWLSTLASTFYVKSLIPSLPYINFVTWSLEVEVVFYLLAPLLATIFLIRSATLRRSILIAIILIDTCLPASAGNDHSGFLFPAQACYFLIGYLLADLRIHQRPGLSSRLWDIASLILWPAMFFFPEFRFSRVLLCILLFACFSVSMLGPLTRRILSVRWIALIGGMCYSIYLMHMLLISLFFRLTRHALVFENLYLNYIVQLILLLPLILAGGTLYFIAIERPCMDPAWPRKLMAKLRGDKGDLHVPQRQP